MRASGIKTEMKNRADMTGRGRTLHIEPTNPPMKQLKSTPKVEPIRITLGYDSANLFLSDRKISIPGVIKSRVEMINMIE